jgi:hypothetical protein
MADSKLAARKPRRFEKHSRHPVQGPQFDHKGKRGRKAASFWATPGPKKRKKPPSLKKKRGKKRPRGRPPKDSQVNDQNMLKPTAEQKRIAIFVYYMEELDAPSESDWYDCEEYGLGTINRIMTRRRRTSWWTSTPPRGAPSSKRILQDVKRCWAASTATHTNHLLQIRAAKGIAVAGCGARTGKRHIAGLNVWGGKRTKKVADSASQWTHDDALSTETKFLSDACESKGEQWTQVPGPAAAFDPDDDTHDDDAA